MKTEQEIREKKEELAMSIKKAISRGNQQVLTTLCSMNKALEWVLNEKEGEE